MLKKTSNARPLTGSVINGYSDSTSNTYSCDYINKMDVYSTSEVKTNKVWIDGKPLYRIVISCGTLPNNSSKEVATGASNISRVVSLKGYAYNGSTTLPIPHANPNLISLNYQHSSNKIQIQTTNNRTAYTETYVIIEYTKTS